MRDTYPYGMFATPMREVVRVHASSGTTGKPTVVGYTKNDIATWAHVMARSMHAAGCTPDDIILNSYGYGLFTGGLGAHYGGECLGATVIPMSGGQTEKQIQLIQDFRPTVIMATPSYMLTIADEMDALGVAPKASSLRVGMFGAEPWTNQMRREIEQRLGIDAIDLYGLSEVIGPGVACECVESKDGPHIWEDHFYPEIIHPETGELLPDGEPGELVLTSLTKEANPIIRYRTRDLTRLLPGTSRNMRRMEKITGRSDDMLIIRGVNVFPSQIEELVLKQPQLAPNYLLEVTRPHTLDELALSVELRPAFADIDDSGQQNIAKELRHHIKSYVGVSVAVRIVECGQLDRSIGKAKRVIDKR
jgi:phenylacetate-CoA ligase